MIFHLAYSKLNFEWLQLIKNSKIPKYKKVKIHTSVYMQQLIKIQNVQSSLTQINK